jgi:hypothetical protein
MTVWARGAQDEIHNSSRWRASLCLFVPVGVPHAFSNPFEEEAIFLNTFTPAYYVNCFRDLAHVASTGAIGQTRLLAVMAKYTTEPA